MGFHVITCGKTIQHTYAGCYDDIANIPNLTSETLIYEADEKWSPTTVGSSDKYKSLIYDWYRAGIKAQNFFRTSAIKEGYILEAIN